MVGGVGGRELLGGEDEHPRYVHRDVAVADHDGALARHQVHLEIGVVRVAVVPADELRRRVRAVEVFARDAQRPIQR